MATAKKLPSGNWRVLIYTGTDNGKRQYKSFTAATKKQAEYNAALFGVKRKRASSSPTVAEAIDRYIDSKSDVLSPKTIKEYRGIRKRSFQAISNKRVDMLTDEQVQEEINTMSRTLSPKTVRNVYALLVSSVRMFRSDFNPPVSLPQRTKTEMLIPQDDAVKSLLSASTGALHTAILLSAVLGLRRSEICALEWRDLRDGRLRVNKAMVLNADKQWVIKTTKTTSSTRSLELPSVVIEYFDTLSKSERIVPVTPDGITYRFIELRDKLHLTVRFHDLRHHYASTLLEMGVPDLYAMRRMGHSTPNMLKVVYQHLKDEKEASIDRLIDERMTKLFG